MAKVLLADDDHKLLPVLALHLRNDDHEVVCARSADEALDAASSSKPDVMVLDIGLIDGGGASVYRRVAEDQSLLAIPVIYLVEEDAEQIGRAPKLPAGSAIRKPVPAGELLAKVNLVLRPAAARERRPSRSAAPDSGLRARDPRPSGVRVPGEAA